MTVANVTVDFSDTTVLSHHDRSAGPCFSFAQVRDQFVEVCGGENAFSLGEPLDPAQAGSS